MFGSCLGAQLIAKALGATITASPESEIGWFPIQPPGAPEFPETTRAFNWHGETLSLPSGATLLAKSAACTNQASRYGERVIGLQSHLETTLDSADRLLQHCPEDLHRAGAFIQSKATISAEPKAAYSHLHEKLAAILRIQTMTQA
jgi:GMP synthase-like glutamine amidotransferase